MPRPEPLTQRVVATMREHRHLVERSDAELQRPREPSMPCIAVVDSTWVHPGAARATRRPHVGNVAGSSAYWLAAHEAAEIGGLMSSILAVPARE